MSEWSRVKLADVAEIRFSNVDKRTIPGEVPARLCNYMDVYGNGGYITNDLPFMEASVSTVEAERFRVEYGDVMLTKDSETPDDIGIPAVVVDEIQNLVCGYHLALIRPNLEQIDSVYLAKQLGSKSTARYFSRLANGSTRYGLSSLSIACTLIPLAPLPQQRRIAEILSTVDEAIEQTEALIAKYQQIKAGLMHDLFTRGVTPDGHLRPTRAQAPHLYRESPLGWIPREWEVRHLAELCATPIRDFGSFSSTNLIRFLDGGVPFIKSEMIEAGKITWDGVMFISEEVHRLLNKSHVQQGNILFSKIGSALGKAVVYDGSRGECNSNAAVAKIEVDCRKASAFSVMYFLNHKTAQTQFKKMIVSLLPRINLGDINRLLVPVPPLIEQRMIEGRLLVLDNALSLEEQGLHKQTSLKHGLMQDLLTGRVRVTVAEPASI